ncbi:protein AATF-like [Branchiostoma floridae]|uniref:Protein AATF-like n=1 Tax=Branchiostoma floridae TaxID=7739 RepID=A0A9J7HUP8_BRAFL|nr:protein AATF-like [Branchiostoma floridae]
MASLADEIAKLTNPAPKSIDPEDDIYTETSAKVADRFEEYDDDDDDDPRRPQHKQPVFLSSLDTKYAGKATSRSALQEDWGQDDSDDEGLDPSLVQPAFQIESSDDDDDDDDAVDENDDDEEEEKSSQKDTKQTSDVTFNPGTFTYQDDSDEDMYESDADDDKDESDNDEEEEEEEEDEDEENESEERDSQEGEGTEAWSFSTPQDTTQELAKAAATKCQLVTGLWDSLLESRIKLQKALPLTNQLPQPDKRSSFIKTGGDPFTAAAEAGAACLRGLLDTLLELQHELLEQNPETSALTGGGPNGEADASDEEITSEESDSESQAKEKKPSKKRRHEEVCDYPECLQKRHKLTQKFNLSTIEKWSEKTKLASGKYNSKAFSSFNKSVSEQIDQILGDQDRLVKRTQLKRSSYKVLGRGADKVKAEEQDLPAKFDPHLKEYDEEIFDDDDFYHQLLRELIEKKTTTDDPTELTKQWLEVQKLRKKVRKKVDTRASKGRKIRYDVHRKLVNFMAPVHNMAMSEEGCNELFSSLFGKKEKSSKTER